MPGTIFCLVTREDVTPCMRHVLATIMLTLINGRYILSLCNVPTAYINLFSRPPPYFPFINEKPQAWRCQRTVQDQIASNMQNQDGNFCLDPKLICFPESPPSHRPDVTPPLRKVLNLFPALPRSAHISLRTDLSLHTGYTCVTSEATDPMDRCGGS